MRTDFKQWAQTILTRAANSPELQTVDGWAIARDTAFGYTCISEEGHIHQVPSLDNIERVLHSIYEPEEEHVL